MAKEKSETRQEMVRPKTGEVQKAAPMHALSPFEEFDRMFDALFSRGLLRPLRWERPAWAELGTPFEGKMPHVDIVDRDDEVMVRAEIPGMKKEEIEVSTTENTVTIRGTTRREEEEEKGEYYRREIASGAFSRTVALPCEVDSGRAKARFKDGVLEMTMPKVAKAKRHTIPVE